MNRLRIRIDGNQVSHGWRKHQFDNLSAWSLQPDEVWHHVTQDMAEVINNSEYKINMQMYDTYTERVPNIDTTLPSGIYQYKTINYEDYLVETELSVREPIIDLAVNTKVIDEFKLFLSNKNVYDELQMPFRRGVMLFGAPGTGKTTAIRSIINLIQNEEMVVIFTAEELDSSYVKALRADKRMKIIIFEEFTNVLRDGGELSDDMLNFLDGETSIDNTFIIATTNYPERLPENVVSRPGRFDQFYKIDYLSKADIIKYLEHFDVELDDKLVNYKYMTIAQLKEIILLMKRDKLSVDEIMDRINEHKRLVEDSFTKKGKVGFFDNE